MLFALRRRRFVHILALSMQLCMAWMSVSALLHSEDDDTICNPVVVLHDHNAHRIGQAKGAASAPEHCFICHSLSLRSLVPTARVVIHVAAEQSIANVSALAAGTTLVAQRPARAPPLA